MSTIKDVAQLARVSTTTVSRFLNGNGYVSADTGDRVKGAVEKLNYHPSKFARGLAGNRADGIGVVVQNFTEPFFGTVLRDIEKITKVHNLQMTVAAGNRSASDEDKAIQFLRQQRYNAVILITSALPGARLAELVEDRVELVHIGQFIPELAARCVYIDDVKGAELATNHLISRGHTRIAHLGLPRRAGERLNVRARGYRNALERAGLPYRAALFVEAPGFDETSAMQATNLLLQRAEPFTAIFVATDLLAVGTFKALRQAGLRVPDDVSVVGFDDIDLAAFLYPTLTTIRQPIQAMTGAATHLALHYLNGNSGSKEVVRQFAPQLIVRDSVTDLK